MDDEDCGSFLAVLSEACGKMGWKIHAYALMGNHYHIVLETPEANLVKGMTWVQGTYTARSNARHKLSGHVFGGRYKAVLVQDGEGDYFSALLDYVHLNPVRAKLVKIADGLDSYPWTSLSYYRKPGPRREGWQAVSKGLAEFGLKDTASGRKKFIARLETKAGEQAASRAGLSEIEGQSLHSTLRRGWYFGTQAFGEHLLEVAGGRIREKLGNANYHGAETKSHGEARAARVIAAGLREFEITEEALSEIAKGDWRKALIARAVKRVTSMKLAWISERLKMGVPAGMGRSLRRAEEKMEGSRQLQRAYNRIGATK